MQDTRVPDSSRILPELAFHALMAVALLLLAGVGSGKPFWAQPPPVMALLLLVSGTSFVAAVGHPGRRAPRPRDLVGTRVECRSRCRGPRARAGCGARFRVAPCGRARSSVRTARPAGIRSCDPPLFVLGAGCRGDGGSCLGGAGSAAGRQAGNGRREKARAGGAGVAVAQFPVSAVGDVVSRNYVPPGTRDQGGITLFGDRYLLTNGDGDLVLFQPGQDSRTLEVEPLAYKVPINITDFMAAAGTTVNTKWFGTPMRSCSRRMATCACS